MITASAPAVSPLRRLARFLIVLLILVIAAMVLLNFTGTFKPRPRIAVVSAGLTPFWQEVMQGATESLGGAQARAGGRADQRANLITPPRSSTR